ncbi:hypothetical protein ACFV4G_22625 [Kitasatospora sp. NPDC059747]|uniref:hypothetical protein n=1 Tax=unclassified Kitasatospora TaxID=2633591 RepID=UPI0036627A74
MTDALLSPPPGEASPPVFDDPRGHRRTAVIAVGVLVSLGCLGLLAVAGGVLYADPRAPAANAPGAGPTGAPR